MKAYKYRAMLWELIAALDSGKHDDLSIDDVKLHARGDTIAKFIQSEFTSADFSLLDDTDWQNVNWQFSSIDNAVDAERKFGVKNKGMSLLLAYTLEGLQIASRAENP